MDALEVLKNMHVEAEAAFREIESAQPNDRASLWDALRVQLALHEQVEERFVYDPVARDAGRSYPILADWEQEHEAQVAEAKAAMNKIATLDPANAEWLSAVMALAATLEGHIRHEEDDIWPRIRRAWGEDKLETAGRQIEAARSAAEAGSTISEGVTKGDRAG